MGRRCRTRSIKFLEGGWELDLGRSRYNTRSIRFLNGGWRLDLGSRCRTRSIKFLEGGRVEVRLGQKEIQHEIYQIPELEGGG